MKENNNAYWGQNFLLVDLRDFFQIKGPGDKKINKKLWNWPVN